MAISVGLVDPSANEVLGELEAKTRRKSHFFRTMAHRPAVLKTFPPFYASVMGPGAVERRIKELVYLACSYANECRYCTVAHVGAAKKAGIADEEIAALRTEQDHRFTEAERAAIRHARELTREAAASGEGLSEHFNEEQIVELTLVAALANFTNRFNNGLQVMPEEE